MMDQVRDTKNTDERWIERIALRDAFQTLSEREKQILILRFYDGKTQMEVAGQVGISQAQVSRLEKAPLEPSEKCDGNLASLEPFPTVGRYCEFAEHRGKPHDVSAGRTHGSAPTAGGGNEREMSDAFCYLSAQFFEK